MSKTFKDSQRAREAKKERQQRERKVMKPHGRNTEQTLWKRLWNEELLLA